MPIRTLLTFYAHENDSVAVAAGMSMANQYQAHLDVLHTMRDVSKDTQALALGVSALHLETIAEQEEEVQIAEAGLLFREFCHLAEGHGITTLSGGASPDFSAPKAQARWLIAESETEALLTTQSHVHDLTLLAWHKEHREIDLEAVLASSARPVMLVPENYRTRTLARASILWNHSAGATHAIASLLPLLKSLEKVEIITTPPQENGTPPAFGLSLEEHLAAHGIHATMTVVRTSGNPAEALYAACEQSNTDLIVMGAFSKKTLRQKLFGGVTKAMLEKTDIPLLMAY